MVAQRPCGASPISAMTLVVNPPTQNNTPMSTKTAWKHSAHLSLDVAGPAGVGATFVLYDEAGESAQAKRAGYTTLERKAREPSTEKAAPKLGMRQAMVVMRARREMRRHTLTNLGF